MLVISQAAGLLADAREMPSLLRLASAALAAAAALAHQEYVALNPNGASVDIPKNVAAIGHVARAGGGPTTKYGDDFTSQGYAWTRALCEADSDGDGQTNGLELGDPCCTWKVGRKLNVTTAISHPGEKKFVTTRSCKEYNCTNKVDPCKPKPLTARGGGVRGGTDIE